MGKNWFSVDPKEHLDGKVAIVTGGGTGQPSGRRAEKPLRFQPM